MSPFPCKLSAKGAFYTSLGQRPRKWEGPQNGGLKARSINVF
jgi:hypothetical protein